MSYVIVAAVFFAAGAYGWPRLFAAAKTEETKVVNKVKAKL